MALSIGSVSPPVAGRSQPNLLQRNYHELELIVEDLKAKELKATDPQEKLEARHELDTWEQLFRAAGGDPARVRPASTLNDFRMALAPAFPVLDPNRYASNQENILQVQQYRAAADSMGGADKEVLARREEALKECLSSRKFVDRLSAVGMGLAQLSWMAAIPAGLIAGPVGLVCCAGALVGGVGLLLATGRMQGRSQEILLKRTPQADVPVLAKWMERGPELVEEHLRRQAEIYNTKWMQKAIQPDPSGIVANQDHILVGGVRLKTRRDPQSCIPHFGKQA